MADPEIPWWLHEIRSGISLSEVQQKYGNEATSQSEVEHDHKKRICELLAIPDDQLITMFTNLRKHGGRQSVDSWELSVMSQILKYRNLT